jgi:hypothetical protein
MKHPFKVSLRSGGLEHKTEENLKGGNLMLRLLTWDHYN